MTKTVPFAREPFQESDYPIQLPCKHVFGKECLNIWIWSENTCPQCRKVVFDESDDDVELDEMIERALDSPPEYWSSDRATLVSILEKDEQEEEANRILRFIDEHTTADEVPNCLLRFVLAMTGVSPSIITDGSCVDFLKAMEEQGPEIFEMWCSTEDFGATMTLIRQELLGLK